MAQRIRREKDIVRKSVDSFVKATSQDYSKYMEGGPTYVTYYRFDDVASRQDTTLEDVHSFTGANSPRKYKKIEDVCVYGIDPVAIQNELTERGLESKISGKMVLLPNSITPSSEDFFSFDVDGLRDHLFRITDVQFDKPTNDRFYEIQWELYPDNSDAILQNVEDEFIAQYENIGGKDQAVVKKATAEMADRAKVVVDAMIDRYAEDFYDAELDEFDYRKYADDGSEIDIWSPYLQHFLHSSAALDKYSPKIMDGFYVLDINETENPGIFRDSIYRKSIFRAAETQTDCAAMESAFASIADYDLKNNRNLPFFLNPRNTYVLELYDNKESFWLGAFHFVLADEDRTMEAAPSAYKFHKESDLDANGDYEIGALLYQMADGGGDLVPKDVYCIVKNGDSADVVPAGMDDMLSKELASEYSGDVLFGVVRDYVLKTLSLSDDLLAKLNELDYSRGVHDYLLTPLAIYCLKKTIDAVYQQ